MRKEMLLNFHQSRCMFFYLLIVLLAAGCAGKEQTEASFLSANECLSPCWQGILPGITPETEVMELLTNASIVDINSVEVRANPYGLTDYLPLEKNFYRVYSFDILQEGYGRIIVKDDTVYRVDFSPLIQVDLQNIVEAWGEPDFVYVSIFSSDLICYRTQSLFIEKGGMVGAGACSEVGTNFKIQNNQVNIVPELPVFHISLFSNKLDALANLETAFYPDQDLAQNYMNFSEPWQGFGYYSVP